ncbi:hypothetical protein GKZ68_10405 [Hymenobacter sp. BRD128]|uniref:hypothetical protein n=1 Tax=Hymenobacter sp. BRD128 TaxID=2675878 RepID=UPI001565D946|nr:hypothetical protein [Hymenobacter sp. BRD128]QKG57001.1 hypothetical protein GKZ68_10405 [Hymenobacter sp. BRD128]
MLRDLWQHHKAPLLCLLIGVTTGWFLSWHGSELPTMSHKQERTTRADQTRSWRVATLDTARAAKADSAARTAYASGQAMARNARQYQRLTTPNHAPLPASPRAALTDNLQRLLAEYGH